MPPRIQDLTARGLAHPPSFLPESVQFEVYVGSSAYGASDDTSDLDVMGFCIPDKEIVFPHLAGHIDGFGENRVRFEVYQEHHIKDPSALAGHGREYDFSIYNIVKFFDLCTAGNPSMLGTLFVPARCVLHMTPIGQIVVDNRKLFLNKFCYPRFRGYATQMLHKIRTKNPSDSSKRKALVEKFGYDTKYAMNLVRLMLECEMILTSHDLDIECNREVLKAIRRGDWKIEDVEQFFINKDHELGILHAKSTIPDKPDRAAIKELLLNCLEQHFGSLTGAVVREDAAIRALRDIEVIIRNCRTEVKA